MFYMHEHSLKSCLSDFKSQRAYCKNSDITEMVYVECEQCL